VQLSAYVVWALALLVLLATGGGLGRSQAVRELLSDEVTRANRGKAYAAGFWGMIATCTFCYISSLFIVLPPIFILHGLLAVGVLFPCIMFASLERQATGG
jgi:hypothetical protein